MLCQNDLTIAGTLAMDLDATTVDCFIASLLTLDPSSTLQFTSLASLSVATYLLADYTALPVPGPLPMLGVSMAFGWSRRLRRRIHRRRTR